MIRHHDLSWFTTMDDHARFWLVVAAALVIAAIGAIAMLARPDAEHDVLQGTPEDLDDPAYWTFP